MPTLKRPLPVQVPKASFSKKRLNTFTNTIWKTLSEHDVTIARRVGKLYVVLWGPHRKQHELIASEKELDFERGSKPKVIQFTGSKGEWKE